MIKVEKGGSWVSEFAFKADILKSKMKRRVYTLNVKRDLLGILACQILKVKS